MENKPPTFWSLVEEWRRRVSLGADSTEPWSDIYTICADELAALVKAHAEAVRKVGAKEDVIGLKSEGVLKLIFGVPPEEGK